jgi:hypothetical protein
MTFSYTFDSKIISNPAAAFGCVYPSSSVTSPLNSVTCAQNGGRVPTMALSAGNSSYSFDIGILSSAEQFHAVFAGTLVQGVEPGDWLANPVSYVFASQPQQPLRAYSFLRSIGTRVLAPGWREWGMNASADPRTAPPAASIEEDFDLKLSVRMPESATNTTVVITVPGNLLFLSANISTIGDSIANSSLFVGQNSTFNSLFSYDAGSGYLTALFGSITNVANNTITAGDLIEVFLLLISILKSLCLLLSQLSPSYLILILTHSDNLESSS